MATTHLIDGPPEWVIAGADGYFEVGCACGWRSPRYDTASLARAAGDFHQAREEAKSERKGWWRGRGSAATPGPRGTRRPTR